jgi:hypothetical protein
MGKRGKKAKPRAQQPVFVAHFPPEHDLLASIPPSVSITSTRREVEGRLSMKKMDILIAGLHQYGLQATLLLVVEQAKNSQTGRDEIRV